MSNRDELLAQMRIARAELASLVAALNGHENVDLGDDWRVRDVLAHIALWERVATWKLTEAPVPYGEGLADQEPWNLDAFNEGMRERWRERPLAEVQEEFDAAHAALVDAVTNAPDEECAIGGRVWTVIDEDGAGHYQHHVGALQTAL